MTVLRLNNTLVTVGEIKSLKRRVDAGETVTSEVTVEDAMGRECGAEVVTFGKAGDVYRAEVAHTVTLAGDEWRDRDWFEDGHITAVLAQAAEFCSEGLKF